MPDRKWFKGSAALAVDDWYSRGDVEANLSTARTFLSGGQPFLEVVRELESSGRSRPEFQYPLRGGRLQGDEFELVTRQGYLKAIELALGHSPPVPINTFWMTGAGNAHFEMHVSDEAQQVSVTLLVPAVDGGAQYAGMPESWVVKIAANGELETQQTSGAPRPPNTSGTARA